MKLNWRALCCSVGILLIAIAVYTPSIGFEFIALDDPDYVLNNPHVLGGLNVENIIWAFSKSHAGNWHPLTWISLAADVEIFGNSARAMHCHNVLLHAANSVLLFWLMVMLAGNLDASSRALDLCALLVLFWVLHPLRTEVVCWVTERKELLSTFFMLLSLLAWVKEWRYLSLAPFALALLSKPMAVSLPAVLFAWDFVMCQRKEWRALALSMIMALAVCVVTIFAQERAITTGSDIPMYDRVVAILGGPLIYLWQTIFPIGLSPAYAPIGSGSILLIVAGALFLISMVAVLGYWSWNIVQKHEVPYWLKLMVFAIGWMYVALLPVIGIIKVGEMQHSDRYTYYVSCGLSVIAMLTCGRYLKHDVRKYVAIAVVLLAVATWKRIPYWHDTITLFRDAVPKCYMPRIAGALAMHLQVKYGDAGSEEGESLIRDCLKYNSTSAGSMELAEVLVKKRLSEKDLERARNYGIDPFAEIELHCDYALSHGQNAGRIYRIMGMLEMRRSHWLKAKEYFDKSLANGEDPEVVNDYLSQCIEKSGKERQ